ncbi:MAG TPA: hypothetical protein ENH82_12900 [bacterium]|nr:hypothetical protein [bacterium]
MDICMTCGTIAESKCGGAECENGHGNMLHLYRCMGCGVELGYVVDNDFCRPEKLACGNCVKSAMRRSKI